MNYSLKICTFSDYNDVSPIFYACTYLHGNHFNVVVFFYQLEMMFIIEQDELVVMQTVEWSHCIIQNTQSQTFGNHLYNSNVT